MNKHKNIWIAKQTMALWPSQIARKGTNMMDPVCFFYHLDSKTSYRICPNSRLHVFNLKRFIWRKYFYQFFGCLPITGKRKAHLSLINKVYMHNSQSVRSSTRRVEQLYSLKADEIHKSLINEVAFFYGTSHFISSINHFEYS